MDSKFNWDKFNRMSNALESLCYVVIVLGPLAGIGLIIIGDFVTKLVGVGVIFASVLISLYHLSFSLLMNGFRELAEKVEGRR